MFTLLDATDDRPTRIDRNVYEILFSNFNQRDTEGLKGYLNRSDALDVFRIVQEVQKELSSVKLENEVLTDFLQTNDPKLLIGMDEVKRQTIEALTTETIDKRKSRQESVTLSPSIGRTDSRSMSIGESLAASGRKTATDYRVNYRTKAELTEKLASEIYKNCEKLEIKGTHDIKILNGQIEELRYQCADTEETIKNFELQFIKNDTLVGASDKQMETHLRKFVNSWLRNGRALLGTMRLKITSLQELCHQQRTALISKADLSGMLGPVDFEQLQIKRDDQTKILDGKNISLAGLKEVTGKASLALAKEKKVLLSIEHKSKSLTAKTVDVAKGISKLEGEARAVEREVEIAEDTLKNIKLQAEEYEAPSVIDYIRVKQELIALEKEEKSLLRKNYIQNIKLQNIAKKLRMQNAKKS